MRNYFMAVDHVFKILDPNCWNSFLPPPKFRISF